MRAGIMSVLFSMATQEQSLQGLTCSDHEKLFNESSCQIYEIITGVSPNLQMRKLRQKN